MQFWDIPYQGFSIQWHITVVCDKKCDHCYTSDERTYQSELERELTTKGCLEICDEIIDFRDEYSPVNVTITGGHPLLAKEKYRAILKKLYENNLSVQILGNVHNLEEEIDFLKSVKVKGYQLSLDGTKEIHDKKRGADSWDEVMRGIEALKEHDIPVDIMFTLNRDNMHSLTEVVDLCIKKGVRRFAFDRVVPIGSAEVNQLALPSKEEYKKFLYDVFQFYSKHKSEGEEIYLALKDQLWKPLLNDMGIFNPEETDKIVNGCPVGVSGISILSDGVVVPCRRLPIKIGKLPEQSIDEIFFKSEKMNELREFNKIEGCNDCNLLSYCRGNRCVAYAVHNDYFSKDPQCWRC